MSFPKLIITGSADLSVIEEIKLQYDNEIGLDNPYSLTRIKHTVHRDFSYAQNASGVGLRANSVAWNKVRKTHTWIGYVDVLTESISEEASGGTNLTMQFIRKATFMSAPLGAGILYNYGQVFSPGQGDPGYFSLVKTGGEPGPTWAYGWDYDSDGYITSTKWNIMDISITDNNNNTSRVTFVFSNRTQWEDIGEILGNPVEE